MIVRVRVVLIRTIVGDRGFSSESSEKHFSVDGVILYNLYYYSNFVHCTNSDFLIG